jgi:hypothetical protein
VIQTKQLGAVPLDDRGPRPHSPLRLSTRDPADPNNGRLETGVKFGFALGRILSFGRGGVVF